jgi:16S rRNA (adenine1518-N6/adenine1519-N6)-dimethyltransferase
MPQKPKLGQNYLQNSEAIVKISHALGNLSEETVVEIGPGRGAITRALAARSRHVLAIEYDATLASALRAEFSPERLTVVQQDVLSFDFAAASVTAGKRLPVVGNLPYYITSPILLKLAASHAAIDRAVLMVQREVADRIVAGPGSREYGSLSVMVQMYGPVERLFTLPPSAFAPPPEVHSTVFRWRFAPKFDDFGVKEGAFLRFVRQIFAQKRKTLANNLRAAGYEPAQVTDALNKVEVSPLARAEELSLEVIAALSRELKTEEAVLADEATLP